jgi:hypothetical protein
VDTASHSISPEQFAAALGRGDAPLVLDARREERFRESQRILPRSRRCAPEHVARFAVSRPPGNVVVYCVYGHEVSRDAARVLRKRPDLGVTGERTSRWITGEIHGRNPEPGKGLAT